MLISSNLYTVFHRIRCLCCVVCGGHVYDAHASFHPTVRMSAVPVAVPMQVGVFDADNQCLFGFGPPVGTTGGC